MKLIRELLEGSGTLKIPYSINFTGANGRRFPAPKGTLVSYSIDSNRGSGIILRLVTSRGKVRLSADLSFDSEAEARESGFEL